MRTQLRFFKTIRKISVVGRPAPSSKFRSKFYELCITYSYVDTPGAGTALFMTHLPPTLLGVERTTNRPKSRRK